MQWDMPDIIVIGGGSAGAAMTGRLCEAGFKVTLIEAGGSDRTLRSRIPALTGALVQNPRFDWCFEVEPDPSRGGRRDIWPAGKLLGGGSAINGMMFIRGHRWDYDNWAAMGAQGWDYASVLPYFRRMETNERGADDWRGGDGPLSVAEGRARYPIVDHWIAAAERAGVDHAGDLNGRQAEGVDHVQVSQRGGMRCSSAAAFLERLPADRAPGMLLHAQVQRIVIEEGRATGVDYVRHGRSETLRSRYGVVVSAGAINTPLLLMRSGIGPAGHLRDMGIAVRADLPGVGRNLQDHVGVHIVNDVSADTLNADARGMRGAWQIWRMATARKGALTTAIGHAQAFIRSRDGLPAPNLQLSFSAFAFDLDGRGRLVLRRNRSVSTLVGLMRPSHRGSVMLRSGDPEAAPLISYQQLGSDDDIDQLVEGIEMGRTILAQGPIASLVTGELRPGPDVAGREALRHYVREAATPMFHPTGTARMGRADDLEAVVDHDLRVRGLAGLWVADASVMPSLPAGNTNATAIMIGDKGADHVRRTIAPA